MEDSAFLGELIAALVYLVAGLRLARLGSRTGERAEWLLAGVFLSNAVSYFLYEIAVIWGQESLWIPLNFAGRVAYLPAAVLLAAFTRDVFRRDSAWAAWLPYGTAALLITGVGISVLHGDWEGYSIDKPWFWPEWIGYTLPFVWAGIEAYSEYRRARRRVDIGLCEPLLCNRFLLWSIFAALQVSVSLVILPQYATFEAEGVFTQLWDLLTGALEILSVATIWLTFFGPAIYRHWIERTALASNSAEG
jgi:hypothetical protein